jgi:glycosyltransferase involved in cell wall biosynthesis
MKVLFISSGNSESGISPIIKTQGESLKREGIDLSYFTIKEKGVKGYLKSILELRENLKSNSYEVVHAHYWLSAIVASLAGAKPIVASLMGDDVKASPYFRWIIYLFYHLSWSSVIVKSEDMYSVLKIKKAHIIPNGVDMSRFRPIDRVLALEEVGWDKSKKHILFTSNPKRVEKNFELAKRAFDEIDNDGLELHYLKGISHERIPYYYNSSSVVVLTSLWEGSPNAIKEAMACNTPIVSTDVGDVKKVISKTEGCYLSGFDYEDFALNIKKALNFEDRTSGREDIAYLEIELIAKKIVDLYKGI